MAFSISKPNGATYWRITEYTVSRPENIGEHCVSVVFAGYADAQARNTPGNLIGLHQSFVPAANIQPLFALTDLYAAVAQTDTFFKNATNY